MPSSSSPPPPSPRSALGPSWRACPDKPIFHVAPRTGWINDPNGLAWHVDGTLHVFYQHIETAAAWGWRMEWGHASTRDGGARWRHHGVVMRPTAGWVDASGCWSGCCVPAPADASHPATLLYTGVRRRGADGTVDAAADAPPIPPHADLGLGVVEVVCAATAVDGGLETWTKRPDLPIAHAPPPPERATGAPQSTAAIVCPTAPRSWAGFRDPFVYQEADAATATPWRLLLGSGAAGAGTLLAYESTAVDPAAPAWRFVGELTTGTPAPLPGAVDRFRGLGCMWECPLLVGVPTWDDGGDARRGGEAGCAPPPALPNALASKVTVIVSPLTRLGPPRSPPIAWTGRLTPDGRFDFDSPSTRGPFATDLGALLYATTVARPPPGAADGRPLAMGWLQEEGERGSDYAGCLSVARRLWVDGDGRLRQSPDPGLAGLRQGDGVHTDRLETGGGGGAVALPGARGAALDVNLTLPRPASASTSATALLLRPWARADTDSDGVPSLAALVADWGAGELRVDWFRGERDDDNVATPLTHPPFKSVGGPCDDVATGRLRLRLLVDGSAVEAFTGCGACLAARVYRGDDGRRGGRHADAPILLAGVGGNVVATDVSAWTMGACWETTEETN